MDSPFRLEPAVLVPREEVVFPLDDKVQRYDPAIRTHSLDHRNLLSITRLLYTKPSTSLEARHDLYTRKYTHLEPSLVEVVDIPLLDRVFIDYVTYKPKPRVYHVGIFVLGSLIIDSASERRRNLGISLYKTVYPSGSNARHTAYGPKVIGHFSKVGELGLKSSRIKVEYSLKKDLLFKVSQFSKVGWYFASWLLSGASVAERAS